jgi:hypothetical protein
MEISCDRSNAGTRGPATRDFLCPYFGAWDLKETGRNPRICAEAIVSRAAELARGVTRLPDRSAALGYCPNFRSKSGCATRNSPQPGKSPKRNTVLLMLPRVLRRTLIAAQRASSSSPERGLVAHSMRTSGKLRLTPIAEDEARHAHSSCRATLSSLPRLITRRNEAVLAPVRPEGEQS